MGRKTALEEEEAIILILLLRRRKRKNAMMTGRPRSMRAIKIFHQRPEKGEYHHLLKEMRLSDPESHFRYLRMNKERFDSLLGEVSEMMPILSSLKWTI